MPVCAVSPDRLLNSGRRPDDDGLSLKSDMLPSDDEDGPGDDCVEITLNVPSPRRVDYDGQRMPALRVDTSALYPSAGDDEPPLSGGESVSTAHH